MDWYEALPDECPPVDAMPPARGRVFFRLVKDIPPTEADFTPHARERPNQTRSASQACNAMALSLLDNLDAAREILKLPMQKGKRVVQLPLSEDAGVVKQTGNRPSHHSWWRSRDFDAPTATQAIV